MTSSEPQDTPVPVTFPVLEPYQPPAQAQAFYQQEQPAPVVPPPPRKKTAVIVLSVLLVLFLSTAGAFGVLYFDQKQESSRLTEQVAKKDAELADSAKKVKDTGNDLTKAKDATKIAEDAQKRAEDEVGLSTKCRDAARKLREAAMANDEGKGTAALMDLFTAC
ncbi:MAG: hypothetical protein ABIQ18_34085 [Umezawaea sp.]